MSFLRVSLVQAETIWHDAAANRELYGRLIAPLAGKSDLVVLPETFTSGFSNDAVSDAEDMNGPSVAWMREQARGLGAVLTGSVVIRQAGEVFNRLLWAHPDGGLQHYDKRHLFRMAGEHQRYAQGRARPLFQLGDWRILPQVCYDLRFPVFSRNRVGSAGRELEYDLMLYVANWPAPRRQHWRTLLRARAIENLAWCIGVNRAGSDGNGIAYAGDSAVIDFLGEPLVELGPAAQVVTTVLSRDALLAHRDRFPAQRDADSFELGEDQNP
jgi:predicted amidohydrolase